MDGSSAPGAQWVEIGVAGDIPLRGARVVRLRGHEIGVFRTSAGEVYAIDNRCPHRGGPLSEGIVHDGAVTCPLHNWVLDLKSGQARGADEGCVRTFTTELREGERIFLRVPVE
jgi:nitrite reductase (NADH) small subunit